MDKTQKIYSPRMFQGDMLDESPIVILSQIKKGDVFYECAHGVNIEMQALTDARKAQGGWLCKVKTNKGIMNIYSSATTEMYAPVFYKSPYYVSTDEHNRSIYLVE
jgi:hypothetical protein